MRQASWIAFLLFTVGLLTYEVALDGQPNAAAVGDSITVEQPDPSNGFAEGGGDFPPPRP
jgi:hypothetical protein